MKILSQINSAKNLQQNKEAINAEINEDIVIDDEEMVNQQLLRQPGGAQQQQTHKTSNEAINNQNERSPLSRISPSTSSALNATSNNKSANRQVSSSTNQKLTQQPAQQEHYNEVFSQLDEKEKPIVKSECELITVTKVIKGQQS